MLLTQINKVMYVYHNNKDITHILYNKNYNMSKLHFEKLHNYMNYKK